MIMFNGILFRREVLTFKSRGIIAFDMANCIMHTQPVYNCTFSGCNYPHLIRTNLFLINLRQDQMRIISSWEFTPVVYGVCTMQCILSKAKMALYLNARKQKKRFTFHFVKILAQCSFVDSISIRCSTMQRLSLVANNIALIPTMTLLYGFTLVALQDIFEWRFDSHSALKAIALTRASFIF